MRSKRRPSIAYNPAMSIYGERHARWVENAGLGLRRVGYADEICRFIRHTGWYTDDDGMGETLRGIVYRLPTRNGRERFAYGYADPFNEGAAFLSFDVCDNKRDAAVWADALAERAAEEERAHNREASAGMRYADLAETVASTRRACLALFAELRALRSSLCDKPHMIETLRASIQRRVDDIAEAREERADLLSAFGTSDAFREYAGLAA